METKKKFGVVGAGLVGSLFQEVPGFEVVHRDQWQPVRWEGLVNTAAIAGRAICEETAFSSVLGANVRLPMQMFAACQRGQDRWTSLEKAEAEGLSMDDGAVYQPIYPTPLYSDVPVPFITFSTSAVYGKPPSTVHKVKETDPLYPQNAYSASKILMEAMLSPRSNRDSKQHDQCFIFRIPRVITSNGHPRDFCEKVKAWNVVEDLYESVIYPETIIKAVTRALTDPDLPRGVYNLASEAVHLPTYIKENYGWEGDIVEPYSLGYCSAVVFDTSKSESVGLI